MNIDWNKVKEGLCLQDVIKAENEELKNRNEKLNNQLEQKENIIKEVRDQLDYLETYSSREDVFEDIKRRLDRIESIIDKGE